MNSNQRSVIGHQRSAIGISVAALLTLPSPLLACEACRDALAGDAVGTALSWTTLLMIGVPMVLMGSIGGWVSFMYWRAARRAAADGSAAPIVS